MMLHLALLWTNLGHAETASFSTVVFSMGSGETPDETPIRKVTLSPYQIDLTEDRYLILTRTTHRLLQITEELRKRNLYHYTNKGKSFVVRIYNASINYNSWCRGIKLDEKEIKDVEEYTGLKQNKWDNTIDWFDAFKKADLSEKEYIKNMIDNGEDLDDRARIKVSTIHAAKGGEEDSVILCLDIGDKIKKAIKKSQAKHDEEHRVWYVGGTFVVKQESNAAIEYWNGPFSKSSVWVKVVFGLPQTVSISTKFPAKSVW